MAWDRHSRFAPFGWAIASDGPARQARQELTSLRAWLEQTFDAYFPTRRGYSVERAAAEDDVLQLSVLRGDFRAEVSIEGASFGDSHLRMFGAARSATIVESIHRGDHLVRVAKKVGATTGVVVFAGVCVAVIGRYEPHYPLSGMLMVVMLLFSLVAGSGIGAWVAEHLAERYRRRARDRAGSDDELQRDLRRWKALSRLLAQQREVIAGRRRRQPFRSEA